MRGVGEITLEAFMPSNLTTFELFEQELEAVRKKLRAVGRELALNPDDPGLRIDNPNRELLILRGPGSRTCSVDFTSTIPLPPHQTLLVEFGSQSRENIVRLERVDEYSAHGEIDFGLGRGALITVRTIYFRHWSLYSNSGSLGMTPALAALIALTRRSSVSAQYDPFLDHREQDAAS